MVPPKLAQSSYAILVAGNFIAMPWHLEGRYGSRTHRLIDDDGMIAIPIILPSVIEQQQHNNSNNNNPADLHHLLKLPGVSIQQVPYYHPSNRTHIPPTIDARIHPERQPSDDVIMPKQQQPPRNTSFTYMELFAGIGGFGVALDALGGTCVFCSELDETCREIYMQNIKTNKQQESRNIMHMHGDITKVPSKDLPKQGSVDLLTAGFPCQPFSSLSKDQPGLECAEGRLFLEIVRVLNVCQPRAFILENVPGLYRHDNGKTLHIIVNELQQAATNNNYTVTVEICDARCLTAMSRKRLFFVGLLQQQMDDDNATTTTREFQFPFVPDLMLRARDVIDYDITTKGDSDDDGTLLQVSQSQFDRLVSEKYWKPAHLAWPDTVLRTLVSHYGNSVGKGSSQLVPVSVIGSKINRPRKFSIDECRRMMGFPCTFQLGRRNNNKTQSEAAYLKAHYRMFGNAVCPPLVAALAGAVLGCIIMGDNDDDDDNDQEACWVAWGRETAVRLAKSALLEKDCPRHRKTITTN